MDNLIHRAIATRQPVEMIYQSKNASPFTQRTVTIYGETRTAIKTYCHMRRAYRLFQKEHILALCPTDKKGRKAI